MELIKDSEEYFGKVRLVTKLMKRKKVEEYETLLKWKLQLLYLKDDNWIEICRIDNYPHNNIVKSHIHKYNSEVLFEDITFIEAEKRIFEIGKRILFEEFQEKFEVNKS